MTSATSTPKHLYPPPGGPSGRVSPTLLTRDLPATGSSSDLQSSGSTLTSSESRRFRIQGWDPILIVAQIVALQTLHYLTLAILVPPLLSIFADPLALDFEGGAANIAMIMDWREMAGRGTLQHEVPRGGGSPPPGLVAGGLTGLGSSLDQRIRKARAVLDGVVQTVGWRDAVRESLVMDLAADARKGWVLGVCWWIASILGVFYLYHLVRRPTHILDHSLTLVLNHLVLTTYYAAAFPTSLFFYFVITISAVIQVVWAENLCVRREMRDGLGVGWKVDARPDDTPALRGQGSPSAGVGQLSGGGGDGAKYARVATEDDKR